MVKERLNADYQTAVDLCKRTREDYIVRMKEIYDEQMSTVNDTKRVIETLKSKTESMIVDLKDDMEGERSKRKEFIIKIKEEMERTFKQMQEEITDKDDKIKSTVQMIDGNKKYITELSKSIGL